jgi:hypothetical protein
MTSKHTDPEWLRTCRIIKAQAKKAHDRGEDVLCWRCGYPLPEDYNGNLIFDVGHISRVDDDNSPSNAAPEHRTRTGVCIGNRNHGGRIGAAITNNKKMAKPAPAKPSTFKAPWWA